MKIYVCVKHVPDSAATITIRDRNRIEENITFLMNPYDEHAVTEAAKLRSRLPGSEVIAVCVAGPAAENTLRSAMAMGADRSILVCTDGPVDSMLAARALAAAIKGDGSPHLILTGKESIDAEGMQTMFRLARHFGAPAAVNAVKITLVEDGVVVECEKEAGSRDVLRLTTPCIVAVGRGLNTPRYPTLPDILKARKREIRKIGLEQLAAASPGGSTKVLSLAPVVERRAPKEITGNPAAAARELVRILREAARVL
ncbi:MULTISPECIES: electron transfer flavoprotein subunit beta/FixA family protein [Desulfococcus]|uniref:Electron transfer flavoprotein alpha/beta-subunit n=1 Tax=Desulfococcus multivorans DSM 2059 TaxID=1121405 RepID=S7VEL2_DESML|nr:electron transfer flavoprotein subunit beta/FixA family protein [Desulfococcus multivorans]AOY56994.1 EtfB3: electron transfer flavoprotein, subunit beta [Desulfococcus multivorans]AQV02816.1 electron transfer flavoprotein subunit beta [Desulfococcus multivorans]EPR42883.1 Electron transfer flavoprotein alpha/beta-subunit [Desulfococcus multivorans DSM 2059]MDX9817528.1 electron transfer flavoprotein subunit beta/FixA family protein [Desulfococcus multivorans]SJZ90094.1 electron transfer fl